MVADASLLAAYGPFLAGSFGSGDRKEVAHGAEAYMLEHDR